MSNYPLAVTSLASFISGGISRIFVYPLDTIKAKLQVQQGSKNPQFTTIRSSISKTLAAEGIAGLYRGMTVATLGSLPAVCLYFTSYEYAKQSLLAHPFFVSNSFLAFFMSGIFAEICSCIIFAPVDVIKERLQLQSNLKLYSYKGGLDAFKTITNTEGIRGIYTAYGATVMSFGPFSAFYFTFYEFFRMRTVGGKKEIGFCDSLLCSAAAGSMASLITNPLDMAKVRMQVVRASRFKHDVFPYRNMFHGIYLIWQSEGFKALFQGSFARILFFTPNTAIIMSLTEIFARKIGNYLDNQD